jgi:ABC-type sulfate/molybdate transport systems ATPase subunit
MVADSAWEGRLARSLSTGQQRLVALARALVGPPPLVVVDEPAAGLGGDDREGIVGALVWARDRGCAVLCATSDPGFAQMLVDEGGRRVNLEGGRMAGGPAIGLVPTPAHFADLAGDGEPEKAESAEPIPSSDRRSSGEESS